MEGAAFGPSPTTGVRHLTEAEAAGVYVQSLEEGTEAVAPMQNQPLPLCEHAHEDHPCGLYICAFDGDAKPSFYNSKGYDYWEVCGKNGRRRGYPRVRDNAQFHWKHSQSLWSRITKAAVGTVMIGGSVAVVGLCAAATDGLGAVHCAVAMSGAALAGGLMWYAAGE